MLLEANQPPKIIIKRFAEVATLPTENLEIPFRNLQRIFKRMSEMEGDVKLSPPTDATVETNTKINHCNILNVLSRGEKK